MNFNNIDLIKAYADTLDVDELEMAEVVANSVNQICSEKMASEIFDETTLPQIVAEYGEHDGPAINEGFSNWIDAQVTEGEIHESQAADYSYVGELRHVADGD